MTSATLTPMSSVKIDDSGAIMVISPIMACAMIGLMWYMIGLGDALIWRDRSQEATDSMAFSSAAIHAHGMNIIAFINIVMSILTAIYLLAAIVYNILDFLLTFTGRTDDHCHLNNATFSMKWRARLRRVHSPAWGDEMLNWIQKKTGIPTGILNNARLMKAMDWIHNYLLDDPQAKYTTAYKALQDGNKHKAKSYLEASSLVPDAFH